MKIPETYCKLEEFVYNGRSFRRNGHTWYLLECKNCGEEYFGYKGSEFCSNKCSSSGSFNGMYGREVSIETREKLSKAWKPNNYDSRKDRNSNWKGGVTDKKLPLYDTYSHQLNWCEKVRRSPKDGNLLEVKCFKCKQWFIPTRIQVCNRIQYLKGNERYKGEFNFYCSTLCKLRCDIYRVNTDDLIHRDAVRAGLIDVDAYRIYKYKVYSISNKIVGNVSYRGRNKYHLDHIYSIKDGFDNNIEPYIMSFPGNLRFISEKENISKGSRSDITKEELIESFNNFVETEQGKGFIKAYGQQLG